MKKEVKTKNYHSTLTKGIIFIILACLDVYYSFFSVFLSQLKIFVSNYYEKIDIYTSEGVIASSSFVIFLIFSFTGITLIIKYLKYNNVFSKRLASIMLYRNNYNIRRLIDENGDSKLKTPITVIFTVLFVIVIGKPIFLNLNHLLELEIIPEIKINVLILLALMLLKSLIHIVINSIETKVYTRFIPDMIEDIDGDENLRLQFIKTQSENHFRLLKKHKKHNNLWTILFNENYILSNERLTIYNIHKSNVFTLEKLYSVSAGNQAIIEVKIQINYNQMLKSADSIKNSVSFDEKGKLDAIVSNFKKFISDTDLDIGAIIQNNVKKLKIQSANILSVENLDNIKPEQIIKSFDKYKDNLNQLNSLCMNTPDIIAREILESFIILIHEQFPVLHQFIEIKSFVKKLDVISEIQKIISGRNDYFEKIFSKVLEHKIKLEENQKNEYIEQLEKLLENNDLIPEKLTKVIKNIKDSIEKEEPAKEKKNKLTVQNHTLEAIIFNSIIKGKETIDLKNPKDKDDLLNFTFKEMKDIPLSKKALLDMKQHVFERFLHEFSGWEAEKDEQKLFDMISYFVKNNIENNPQEQKFSRF